MTPNQSRAEEISEKLLSAFVLAFGIKLEGPVTHAGIYKWTSEMIAKALEEFAKTEVEWKVKEMLSEPFMLAHFCKGREEGAAQMRERAAKFIEQYREEQVGQVTAYYAEDRALAESIRALPLTSEHSETEENDK